VILARAASGPRAMACGLETGHSRRLPFRNLSQSASFMGAIGPFENPSRSAACRATSFLRPEKDPPYRAARANASKGDSFRAISVCLRGGMTGLGLCPHRQIQIPCIAPAAGTGPQDCSVILSLTGPDFPALGQQRGTLAAVLAPVIRSVTTRRACRRQPSFQRHGLRHCTVHHGVARGNLPPAPVTHDNPALSISAATARTAPGSATVEARAALLVQQRRNQRLWGRFQGHCR